MTGDGLRAHLVLIDRAGVIAYVKIGYRVETSPPWRVGNLEELLAEPVPAIARID